MNFISHLLDRLSNSSKVSSARTADWINSQAIVGTSSESPSASFCNDYDDHACDNPTLWDRQTRQGNSGSNLQVDNLLNSTYSTTNMPAGAVANGRMLEEGLCFDMGCQVCETPTPAEQILARNQNLCGLRIMLEYAGDGEEEALSSAGSDDTGGRRRGFLKRKAKRIIRFCGHLYGSLARRWSSISAKSVSNS